MHECSFTDFTNLQTFKKSAWPHLWKKLRIPCDPLFSLRSTKELALAFYRMLESLCYIRKTHLGSKNTVEYW